MKPYFENQTRLLVEVLGTVVSDPSVALKGGTAINFFHTNMPRLSVDIDLTYIKINPREEFLQESKTFFQQLNRDLPLRHDVLTQVQTTKDGIPKQIYITSNEATIKTDLNLVIRGTVYPPVFKESCAILNQKYETQLKLQTLSFEDIYAGKFCAALDRQHPRDLFDVMIFFQDHQVTEKLMKAFLVYLISSNRPIAELINPNRLKQNVSFDNEFVGMTNTKVTYSALEEARETFIQNINRALSQQDREFLLSFKTGNPLWQYLNIEHVQHMPAVKWKLHNIAKMERKKHKASVDELKRKLEF